MLHLPWCVYPARRLVHATRYPLTQSHSRPCPPPRTHKRSDEGNTPVHLNTKSELSQAFHDHSQIALRLYLSTACMLSHKICTSGLPHSHRCLVPNATEKREMR